MAIERDAVIRVKVQGAQQAEAQLDGVSGALNQVDASADALAASTQKAGVSFASAGEAMERGLKPIDSTFKGFDRINGIIGQVTNAARILSGVALLDLGRQFLDIAKTATGAGKAIAGIAKSVQQTARQAEAFSRTLKGLTGSAGLGGLLRVSDADIETYLRLQEGASAIEAGVTATIQRRAQIRVEVAQLEARVRSIGETLARDVQAGVGPAGVEFLTRQSAEAQARLALLRQELDATGGSVRPLVVEFKRLNDEMGRLQRRAAPPSGGGGEPGESVLMASIFGVGTGLADDLAGYTPGGGGTMGGDPFAGAIAFMTDFGFGMSAAQAEAALLNAEMRTMATTAQNVGRALDLTSSAVGSLSSGLQAAGVQTEVINRIQNTISAATMTAKAAEMFATAAGTAAGGLFGLAPPPNPVLAAAQYAAGTLYAGAAVAYGVAAAAGGGGGGGVASSGGVGAAPSPGAYGSAVASGGGGGGAITINVNSPGAAFLSRSERQRLGTELGGMMLTAMGARGSGLRAGFNRELGRS